MKSKALLPFECGQICLKSLNRALSSERLSVAQTLLAENRDKHLAEEAEFRRTSGCSQLQKAVWF